LCLKKSSGGGRSSGRGDVELERARLAGREDEQAIARVEGVAWSWPAETTIAGEVRDEVRLLAPFDPIVWDRRRFELLWGWAYRFEAYTPLAKRQLGYYALPLLWRDRVIGWGNAFVTAGVTRVELGYVSGKRPRDRGFTHALDAELDRLRAFLDVGDKKQNAGPGGPAPRN